LHQLPVAVPCHLGELALSLRLFEGSAQLCQGPLSLSDLVLDLRCSYLHEQIAGLHPAADVDVALGDVAAGAGIDVCLLEGFGSPGPARDAKRLRGAHRRSAHRRHEVAPGICGRHHLGVHRVMLPEAVAEGADEKGDYQKGQEGAAGPTTIARASARTDDRPGVHAPGRRCPGAVRARSYRVLCKDALRGFAVIALAQQGEKVWYYEKGGRVANRSPPITARARAAFCSSPG